MLARVNTDEAQWYDVVGVVEHQRRATLAAEGREVMFFPEGHIGVGAAGRWIVRTSSDPRAMAPTRFALVLIAVFAVVAVVLASVGLYGVLAGVVRQRTSEIGVRMAFGAPTTSIFESSSRMDCA